MSSQTEATDTPVRWTLPVGARGVSTGAWTEVRSPYSGRVVATVAQGNADIAREAVDAAHTAMAAPLAAYERAEILSGAAAAVLRRREEFAELICAEAGKPVSSARAEADRAASTLSLCADEARRLVGSMIPMDAAAAGVGKIGFTVCVPVGVVAAISPFNFPLNLVAHKVGPAIAAGCAVVLKPASQTPTSALLLAQVFTDAGLPPGWLNVVVGPAAQIGDVLVEDDRVRLISFTGSAAVGWAIASRAPKKRVKLELGNAAPVIVEPDADVDLVARKISANAFSNAGQSCISIQRVYVARRVFDPLLDSLLARVAELRVGDPADETTDVGPVIDTASRDRILAWIDSSGGRVVAGGRLTDDGILEPTVIAEPRPTSEVCTQEVFGPVCSVMAYDTLDEAIALANATQLGLQASIFTNDYRTAMGAAQALEFGAVIVNEAPTWRTDQMPYGGVKDSGNTKEGPAYTIRDMVDERLVVLQL